MNKSKGITIAFILTAAAFLFLVTMIGRQADQILQENKDLRKALAASAEIHKTDSAMLNQITREANSIREQLREREKSDRGGDRLPLLTSLGEYTLTAYCSCEVCCGEWAKLRKGKPVTGSAGVELTASMSVAADLPIGTELMIGGRRYIVQDRPAEWIIDRYNGKIIDIYFQDHGEALEFGKQKAEVYVVK